MANIVITEFMDEDSVKLLTDRTSVLYEPDLVDREKDLLKALASCTALVVRNRTQVDKGLVELAPNLRLVGRLGVGLDNIDLQACAARGIAVHPATGANDDAVAEYVVCSAMLLLRGAFLATGKVAAGEWPRAQLMGRELAGTRAGLVGFGGTARKTAARFAALGVKVAASDPILAADDPAWQGVERLSFENLLASCDVISLHVPLTPDTQNLLGKAAIAKMKKNAILINAARGGVVDEVALVEALKAKLLGGAALDVFEKEPLNAENGARFMGIHNLILTPHIAGVTVESNVRVSDMIARIVLRELGLT